MKRGNIRRPQIKFRCAYQGDAKRSERVAERSPLRHGGHFHQAQRHANDRANHQRDRDRSVVDDSVVQQGAGNRQRHADFAGPHAALRRGRRAHPLERQDEQRAGDK